MAALFLVEEIEGGYFDKLRAIPIPRYAIVLGRLVAEGAKCVVISILIALKTRSAAATNSGGLIFFPLLFLTPNFVPRDLLTSRWRSRRR